MSLPLNNNALQRSQKFVERLETYHHYTTYSIVCVFATHFVLRNVKDYIFKNVGF